MLRSEIFVPVVRRNIAYSVVIVLFAVLLGKFYLLQIYQYEKYVGLADFNRIRSVTTHAPRGRILDRNGKVLAATRAVYTISVIRDEMSDEEHEFDIISRYLGMTRQEIGQSMKKYYRGRFLPARIARDVPIEKLSFIEEHRDELPGVIYSEFPVRFYPSGNGVRASHVLGYLREITNEELQVSRESGYNPGDFIGAQGAEKKFESRLRGLKGFYFQQVDALGRAVGMVRDREPIPATPGGDVRLTLDADFQKKAEELMHGRVGAVVVLNADSGDILAMVSKPDYSLEDFAGFMEADTWEKYLADESRPLLNRAILGLYPPGSAMKLITAIAALEEGVVDLNWTVVCSGAYHYGDRVFGCWREEGHGVVNLYKAIVESCNVYFYQLVQRIGLDVWYRYARMFGFGEKTNIEVPEEYAGIIPGRDFMDGKYGKRGWTPGYLLNIAIGQGDILVTPLQMARFMAIVATRGEYVQPSLLAGAAPLDRDSPHETIKLKKSTWDRIHQMTFDVVNKADGTAYNPTLAKMGIKLFGKTGTAENPHGEPHAWFIGFARKGESTIALSLLVENGGTGGSTAAPLAQELVQYIFRTDSSLLTLR